MNLRTRWARCLDALKEKRDWVGYRAMLACGPQPEVDYEALANEEPPPATEGLNPKGMGCQ